MPSYKLIYFNSRGRIEGTRLLFAAAGVKYEDCRLNYGEFAKLKAGETLPFGQLPVLEVDGKMLAQSITIFKYVAREIGFAPTDSFELAKADMIVDGLMDVMTKVIKFAFEEDEEKKKALEKKFYEEDLSLSLEPFEKLLKSTQDGKYFVGNKMTFADILFFTSVDSMFQQDRNEDVPAALNHFPLLKDLFSRVLANPGIREWLKKRPVTPM